MLSRRRSLVYGPCSETNAVHSGSKRSGYTKKKTMSSEMLGGLDQSFQHHFNISADTKAHPNHLTLV